MLNSGRVLLTDTHWRTAYYVCKSLAKKGIDVIGLKSAESVYERSRFYSDLVAVPSLETNSEEWLNRLEQVSVAGDVLIPISMEAINLVANNKARLSKNLIVPSIDTDKIKLTSDKLQSLTLMQNIGIPVPLTFVPHSENESEEVFAKMRSPIVIKLREEKNISPIYRYGIAQNVHQLRDIYKQLSSLQELPLVQQYIEGTGFGISLLADNGRLLALFSHKRLREQMVSGGPSTYCSTFNSPVLEDYAKKFAEATNWSGIAMLEFKYHRAEDKYYFMEINPRFWGSMELAIKCGVDFPYLFFLWLTSQIKGNGIIRKKRDLRLKYLSTDIKAFADVVSSLSSLNSRLRALCRYLLEFIDPQLRIGILEGDWELSRIEMLESLRASAGLIRYVI